MLLKVCFHLVPLPLPLQDIAPISRAASRTPARVILRVEGEIARPCATDQQLVGVGQGVCVLPNQEGTYDVGRGAGRVAGRRIGGAATAHAACKEKLD